MNGSEAGSDAPTKAHAQFIPVKDPKLLIPILKERHPHSCYMYNQVILSDNFKGDLKFYTLTHEVNSDTWIVSYFARVDYGCDICISAPNSIVKENAPIPSEIKECFSSGDLIDWDDISLFISLEKPVSAMILDISVNIKGNVNRIHPCILYYMEIEEALKISIDSIPGVEVARLDQDRGTDFIMETWKYAKPESRSILSQCIGAAASAGVFVDGKCVSGVSVSDDGLLHSLYTSKDYRNRGFGKLTMNYCFKEFAKDGCYPCSNVEIKNPRSIAFHESLGAKPASIVDYVEVQKLDID